MIISVYKSLNIEKIYIQHRHLNSKENRRNNLMNLNSTVKNQSKFNMYIRKLVSFHSSVKECNERKCEFCCLGRHKCGSKIKCDNFK